MKKYAGIDLVKFIMAFAVVAIHTCPLIKCTNGNMVQIYNQFVELANPFFFMASGYLLFVNRNYPYRSESDVNYLVKYLHKIVRLYVTWMLLYTPLAIWHFVNSKESFGMSAIRYIRGWVLTGEQYNAWPLWYLLSTIYAMTIIIILLKLKQAPAIILFTGVISSIIWLGLDCLVYQTGEVSGIAKLLQMLVGDLIRDGRLFRGLFYISIGMFLAYCHLSEYIYFIFLVMGFLLNLYVDNYVISQYLMSMTAIGLFGIISNLNLRERPIYVFLRKISTIIYFVHMYVWSFYYKIVYGNKTYGMDSFIVTSIISVVISIIVIEIGQFKRIKIENK